MRCRPSILISRTTNGVAAWADTAVTLRPTSAHERVRKGNKIFSFMRRKRKEIKLDMSTAVACCQIHDSRLADEAWLILLLQSQARDVASLGKAGGQSQHLRHLRGLGSMQLERQFRTTWQAKCKDQVGCAARVLA